MQTATPAILISSLTTPKNHSVPDFTPQVVSIFPLLDDRQLVLVSRGGDIATLPMDDPTPEVRKGIPPFYLEFYLFSSVMLWMMWAVK